MADSSGTHLWLVLMKAHRSMGRHAQQSIAAHDIGFSDFTILESLLHKGPMLVNEIGRRIHLTSGSITTAVDRLEKRGLVERSADASDRRAKQASLTRPGPAEQSGGTGLTSLTIGSGNRSDARHSASSGSRTESRRSNDRASHAEHSLLATEPHEDLCELEVARRGRRAQPGGPRGEAGL